MGNYCSLKNTIYQFVLFLYFCQEIKKCSLFKNFSFQIIISRIKSITTLNFPSDFLCIVFHEFISHLVGEKIQKSFEIFEFGRRYGWHNHNWNNWRGNHAKRSSLFHSRYSMIILCVEFRFYFRLFRICWFNSRTEIATYHIFKYM